VSSLRSNTLRTLLEATNILHSHGQSSFRDRLFQAVSLLYSGMYQTFEVLDPSNGFHKVETTLQEIADLQERATELFALDHPLFPLLMSGKVEPTRLSDLVADRTFQRTNFYNEVLKPVDVRHQIAIPFVVGTEICGLTVARSGKNYSDEDMEVARILAQHIATAYASDQLLKSASNSMAEAKRFDHEHLRRRGLTRRECEVLWWVAEGKANSEIAVILNIVRRTVELHLTSVFRKLGVENRTSAIANAHR
jgi:DNA-binding CsgD family transcriptional regulator